MIQPDELKSDKPLMWSPGHGTDVWALFCACIDGDLARVQQLVEHDPSLARCHYAYRTPLYFAVRENRIPVVEFLLQHGSDPLSLAVNDTLLEICSDRGYSKLAAVLERHYRDVVNSSPAGEAVAAAIRDHDLPRVRQLLDASPELLHAGDLRSNQPIHWATMTRQLEFIDELLSRGADINATRYGGARPIHLTNGDYHYRGWRDVPRDWPVKPAEVLAHLRARGAYIDICTASHIGDIERVRELLAEDPSLANRVSDYITYYAGSGTPLNNAVEGKHLEIVKLLLEHGADPNLPEEGIAPHGKALYSAAAQGSYEIAELLLANGAFPNPPVESSADALSRAVSNDDKRMIDLLCSHGAARSLDLLAYYGDVMTAAAMLHANPTLAEDPEALSNAAGEGQEAFLRLLLHYVPDLPKRVHFPTWSTGAKTRELNKLLFQHGMNPSQRDWLMTTPLHQFARTGSVDKAEWFIEHGADVNARDEDICSTPLGWAAKYNQLPMAELLIKAGARTNVVDDPPWATPLAWAKRRGHQEMVALLERHGAN
jgi:ankyrin repeat protein